MQIGLFIVCSTTGSTSLYGVLDVGAGCRVSVIRDDGRRAVMAPGRHGVHRLHAEHAVLVFLVLDVEHAHVHPNDPEQDKRDDQEVHTRQDELSEVEVRRAVQLRDLNGVVICIGSLAVEGEVGEVDRDEQRHNRGEYAVNKTADDTLECRTDDDTDGQLDDIPAVDERLEVFQPRHDSVLRGLDLFRVRSTYRSLRACCL